MKTSKLIFKTMGVAAHIDGDTRKRACRVTHNAVLDPDGVAADMAATMRIDEVDAKYYLNMVATYIVRALSEGKKLNLGAFSLSLAIRGCVYGANGAFERGRNALSVTLAPGKELKHALDALEPVNACENETPAPHIGSCIDTATKREGEITPDATLYVAGASLETSQSAEDEGVFLEDDSRRVIARGTVVASSAITLDCVFRREDIERAACDPLALKRCWLALYTRSGRNDPLAPPFATRRRIAVNMPTRHPFTPLHYIR